MMLSCIGQSRKAEQLNLDKAIKMVGVRGWPAPELRDVKCHDPGHPKDWWPEADLEFRFPNSHRWRHVIMEKEETFGSKVKGGLSKWPCQKCLRSFRSKWPAGVQHRQIVQSWESSAGNKWFEVFTLDPRIKISLPASSAQSKWWLQFSHSWDGSLFVISIFLFLCHPKFYLICLRQNCYVYSSIMLSWMSE